MPVSDAKDGQFLTYLEMVTTLKRIATPFEEAYQWLKETQTQLPSRETIAFARKGKSRVNHLTWSDLAELHSAYQRLSNIEVLLNSREIENVHTVSAVNSELA